jgi:hypothetical protein
MTEHAMIYAAVYANVDAALADLDVFERLCPGERTGKYDAVVIDKHDGEPRIVKRADRAAIRARMTAKRAIDMVTSQVVFG